jgi:hypothetical protein
VSREELLYWGSTGLFCVVFLFGGVNHLLRSEAMAQEMTALGYPLYVMTILGVAKVAGAVALLAPKGPLLKEWAYAGFAFDLLGAIASHAFVADPVVAYVGPIVLLGLGAASYHLRPPSRRVGPQSSLAS